MSGKQEEVSRRVNAGTEREADSNQDSLEAKRNK